ncbi:sulfotransferase family protein [Aspergillus mulundensis]|uniref:NAD dependent epimerase n=1 Tax=Aspergillus mulundensis TaxID=1810919 RepID=A0A3D8T5K5_9EURO|nr:hypothetical protein DSM5745_01126 [Aspergillus mulundensis]RDW93804.1 hypothetical protein DSM5745_01126 [Aspergillus mulundensis]
MAANAPFPAPHYPRERPQRRTPGREMKVLCLGLPQTGTLTLYRALNTLGYNTYHLTEACLDYQNDALVLWNTALRAKYYIPELRSFEGADFERMLWRYDAVIDMPASLFIHELMDAYPDAQIILNTAKDADSWVMSMENSYYKIIKMKRLWLLAFVDTIYLRPFRRLLRSTLNLYTQGKRTRNKNHLPAYYKAHNAHVRGAAQLRGRKVLEYNIKQGWKPLCEFLNREIPKEDFPVSAEEDFIVGYQYIVVWWRVWEVFWRAAIVWAVWRVLEGVASIYWGLPETQYGMEYLD